MVQAKGDDLTPEQELWGVVLWVEKHHGADGPRYIAEQIGRLALEDDKAGMDLWRKVAERYDALRKGHRAPH